MGASPHALAAHRHSGGAGPGSPPVTAPTPHPPWARGRAGPARVGAGARAYRLSRSGGWAGPDGSPRLPPESPQPRRAAAPPARSAERAPVFSCILRIRTCEPVVGPCPIGPQALPRPAHGFLPQTSRGHTLFMAHLGGQGERPDARGLALGARRLMQKMLETLPMRGVQGGLHPLGPCR